MSAITKEQVFEAADALSAAGLPTKVADVRQKLGRGSFSTITEHLRAWKQAHKAPEAPKKDELPQSVLDLAGGWWSAALKVATESLEADRQLLEQQRQEMEEDQREAVAFADSLLLEGEQLKEKLQESQTLLTTERLAHEDTRNKLQAATGELIEYRASHENMRERTEDFKRRADHYEAQFHKSEEEVKEALRRAAEQENKIIRLEGQLEKLQAELNHQVENLVDELERERAKSAEVAKAAEADRAAAQAAQIEVAKLQGELSAAAKKNNRTNS
ncbi:DNA-binding protein [Paenibacillus enshidis]|uniref:DNA-binding protein n=1 Tax=Paenibacillus enshidis TaxID=1458439 RepID=A0ABV5B0B6_9BACL